MYFGSYNQNYSRNRILIEGLRFNGVEVVEIHDRSSFLLKYLKLFFKHWPYRRRYDFLIVGFPGFTVMPLAKLIATAPIIFDAFLSLYDSNVFDRKICSPKSLRAKYYYFLDRWSCQLADLILLDTKEHIKYFVEVFRTDRQKFRRIFIGAQDEIFLPQPALPAKDNLSVLFWGWMIPLQGVEFILQAAKILEQEPIEFLLIGGGVERDKMLKLAGELGLAKVKFLPGLKQEQLPAYIAQAGICLGIFGQTSKARRVIPNKVYEALASQKAVITARTEASREVLVDGEHCLFCRPADPQDLAEKIKILKSNPDLRQRLARQGYKLYLQKFTPRNLGFEFLTILQNYAKEK